MAIADEYDTFQRLTSGLSMAKDAARMMAIHRPDQAKQWMKMAEVYGVAMQSIWKLAEESGSMPQ